MCTLGHTEAVKERGSASKIYELFTENRGERGKGGMSTCVYVCVCVLAIAVGDGAAMSQV